MGYDCKCTLPDGTKFSEVEEFLGFLDYARIRRGLFYYFEEEDYLSISGVMATVKAAENGQTFVFLHSQIFASNTDIEHFNKTAKYSVN